MDRGSGRRFDDIDYRNKINFDKNFRKKELDRYIYLSISPVTVSPDVLRDHMDFALLLAVCRLHDKYFDKFRFQKIIDTIDGYYFAYCENFISSTVFCEKINKEIIEKWLCPRQSFNKLAVRP